MVARGGRRRRGGSLGAAVASVMIMMSERPGEGRKGGSERGSGGREPVEEEAVALTEGPTDGQQVDKRRRRQRRGQAGITCGAGAAEEAVMNGWHESSGKGRARGEGLKGRADQPRNAMTVIIRYETTQSSETADFNSSRVFISR